ncbi:MAG: YbhB/YbcL family Raf kinase inhibitor-like protein [Patescibacteria group bacterium]
MILTSPSFENNGFIPEKFTCDGSTSLTTGGSTSAPPELVEGLTTGGGDINPELHIQNVPDDAKSLALIVDDPDAPGRTFVHWLVWNIDPKTEFIKEESSPPGLPAEAGGTKVGAVEGKTDFGAIGYGGPCPPQGVHRYFFKLYALDATLNLPAGSDKRALEAEIEKHLITQTELVGLYQRNHK